MTTGFFAPKVRPTTLAVTQMAVSTLILVVVTPFVVHITLDLPWQVWAAVVWTAVSGTIYAFFIQSWAQRYTTSTHAAILLGFESVFAAIAGIIAGMDSVTWRLLVGGSLMLTGVFIVELLPGEQGDRGGDRGGGGYVETRRRMCRSVPLGLARSRASAPSSYVMTQRTSCVPSPQTRILSPSRRAGRGSVEVGA